MLQALQSPDNSIRSQAEEHLHNSWTNTRPEMLLMGLVEQIQATNSETVVRFAPVPSSGTSGGSSVTNSQLMIDSSVRRCHLSSNIDKDQEEPGR